MSDFVDEAVVPCSAPKSERPADTAGMTSSSRQVPAYMRKVTPVAGGARPHRPGILLVKTRFVQVWQEDRPRHGEFTDAAAKDGATPWRSTVSGGRNMDVEVNKDAEIRSVFPTTS